jgi:DNA-binding MarR family transcriptional regulator
MVYLLIFGIENASARSAMEDRTYQSDLTIDEKVLMGVVRAAETYKRMVSAMFKKHGLSFPQYNILRVLDASEKGRSRIMSVSRIMIVPGANMTGLAKRLEKGGFIKRKSDPHDERATVLEITPKGKKTLAAIETDRDRCLETMLKGFSPAEKDDLLMKLRKLLQRSKDLGA